MGVKRKTNRLPQVIELPALSMEAYMKLVFKERQEQLRKATSYHNIFNKL